MRLELLLPVCTILFTGCSSDSPTGPTSVIGNSYHLLSINGSTLPVQYYAVAGDFQATALSGSIVFLANGYVRAATHRRVDYVSPLLPDEDLTSIDSVPYRVVGQFLLIERIHGWDTAQVNGGLLVHWTTSTASLGVWRYLQN